MGLNTANAQTQEVAMQIRHVFDDSLENMIQNQLVNRGIRVPKVLEAFRNVDRKDFVLSEKKDQAYADQPLGIEQGQTISQPYIVGFMLQALELKPSDKVLEIGTGSLYNAALLAELAAEVYTIEVKEELYKKALLKKAEHQIKNVHLKHADGSQGWPENAPYDAIILTAAPAYEVPSTLFDQLKLGGRLIAPVGHEVQDLYLYTKQADEIKKQLLTHVRFVPLVTH